VPVCFVSAKTGAGVAELLDVLVKLAPSPAEGNPPLFYKGEGEAATEFRSEPDPKKHVLAHVFKVVWTRSWASSASSAFTRAPSPRTRSSS
jgi:elongation factor G